MIESKARVTARLCRFACNETRANRDIKPSIYVVAKIADALEVSVEYLTGQTNLVFDKETIHQIEDISNLKEENKNFIFNLIDMALRDMKTKKAYS